MIAANETTAIRAPDGGRQYEQIFSDFQSRFALQAGVEPLYSDYQIPHYPAWGSTSS